MKREAPLQFLDRRIIPRLGLSWEGGLYLLVFFIALGMRLWGLDSRAIHHDESLHAFYSWRLFAGQGYEHNPMMHGPFQFHATALIYHLFGASDYTTRLLPGLFGAVLAGMPYFLRHQIGRRGGLVAAILLTFSPSLLYFSRFARNDIYIAVWITALVICCWRYLDEGKTAYLYGSAAALSLCFCTKEASFIMVAILGSFLFIMTAKEWARCIRSKINLSHLSRPAAFLLVLATLTLPQLSAGISIFQHQLGLTLAPPPAGIPEGGGLLAAMATGLILIAASVFLGLRWNARVWLKSAAIFYTIYILLFTTFFTNLIGLGSGLWCSLSYWIIQHGVQRGGQPWYYYLLLLPTYEFLPLVLAFTGGVYYWIRGKAFSHFLIYWALMSMVLYSWSGEKMPWLVIHMALPLIFLGGKYMGHILESRGWRKIMAVMIFSVLLAFSGKVAWQASYSCDDAPEEMLVYSQISCDVPKLVDDIQRLAQERGEGEALVITVDSEFTWPLVWYLRDYDNVSYLPLATCEPSPGSSVLVVSSANREKVRCILGDYGGEKRFFHRLWFPLSEYRDGFDLLSTDTWRKGWEYFAHRTTASPYTSSFGFAYFPRYFDSNIKGGER